MRRRRRREEEKKKKKKRITEVKKGIVLGVLVRELLRKYSLEHEAFPWAAVFPNLVQSIYIL